VEFLLDSTILIDRFNKLPELLRGSTRYHWWPEAA
jgi:hypothetical protein